MAENLSYMKGIHTILTTPFNDDYSLDLEGLEKNVQFGAESNAEALIVLGSEGEFFSLTFEEKKAVIEAAVKSANGKKPIIAGVGDTSTHLAVELTRHAYSVGADAVIATPPFFSTTNEKSIYMHFKEINQVGLPIVLYNVPGRQGYNLSPEFLEGLCELEQIVALKQATKNIAEHEKTRALLGDRIAVFGGSEGFMYPVLALGHVGSSATAATCFPQYFVDIYEAVQEGNLKKAQQLYDNLEPFRRVCEKNGQAAVVKYVSQKFFGLAGGPVRLPLLNLSQAEMSEIDNVINELGVSV